MCCNHTHLITLVPWNHAQSSLWKWDNLLSFEYLSTNSPNGYREIFNCLTHTSSPSKCPATTASQAYVLVRKSTYWSASESAMADERLSGPAWPENKSHTSQSGSAQAPEAQALQHNLSELAGIERIVVLGSQIPNSVFPHRTLWQCIWVSLASGRSSLRQPRAWAGPRREWLKRSQLNLMGFANRIVGGYRRLYYHTKRIPVLP